MPATCTLKGLGAVEADYPYYLGHAGDVRHQSGELRSAGGYLLIAVGARFDDPVTGNVTPAPHASVM
ncbi:hypothetical protein ACLK1Z_21600 [Escherichia coli]